MKTLSDLFFLTLYRWVVAPILLLLSLVGALFVKKLKRGWELRLHDQRNGRSNSLTDVVWIHCASGEFEYAKPVIRALKAKHPKVPVLVTYFSPSYHKPITNFAGVDLCRPLPLDFPGPIQQFIKNHRPKALLIARSDLWPELLYQVHRHQIPILLFSMTRSHLRWHDYLFFPFHRWIYSKITDVFCVSDEDKESAHFLTGRPNHCPVAGDTRYDEVIARIEKRQELKPILSAHDFNGPTLVCGSTWPEDEDVIIKAASRFMKDHPLRLIIAPHEPTPHHIEAIREKLKDHGLESILYTQADDPNSSNKVILIDTIGVLADVYRVGQMAFIGGSFRRKVHSVMEPLCQGLCVIVGPHYRNNREAIEFHRVSLSPHLKAVNVVKNEEEFYHLLINAFKDQELTPLHRDLLKNLTQKNLGASHRVVQWLEPTMNQTT